MSLFTTYLQQAFNPALSNETRLFAIRRARKEWTEGVPVNVPGIDSSFVMKCIRCDENELEVLILNTSPILISGKADTSGRALTPFTARDELATNQGGRDIVNTAKRAVDPVLAKYGITNPVVDKFKAIVDVSKSMDHLYKNGSVQILTERALSLAHRLLKSDHAVVDTVGLGSLAKNTGRITPSDYMHIAMRMQAQYEENERDTNYLPSLQMAVGNGTFSDVIYALMVTDGENNGNKKEFAEYVESLSTKKIFVQFIGIGEDYRKGCRYTGGSYGPLVDLSDTYPYIGFFGVANPKTITDQELYELMLEKFAMWAKVSGLVNLGDIATSSASALRNQFLTKKSGDQHKSLPGR